MISAVSHSPSVMGWEDAIFGIRIVALEALYADVREYRNGTVHVVRKSRESH